MLRIPTRQLLAAIVAAVVGTVTTVVVGAAPAHAAASGNLQMKGTGSVYTENYIVNLGVVPGGPAKSWGYRVVNTGAQSQQYKLTVAPQGTGHTATLFLGSRALPNPFYTPPIEPGDSLALALKVSVAAGQPQGEYFTTVALRDPETNAVIESVYADANATYQAGTQRNDLFLKTGTQPYVGGSIRQYETANTLKPGRTATFALRLQNNGSTPAAITLNDTPNGYCPADFSMVVKRGTKDVTAAVVAGTYNTGTMAPGAKQALKVQVKLLRQTSCEQAYFGFVASGLDGQVSQHAHVVVAAP